MTTKPIKTMIPCKDRRCPANVGGMCGPAKVRNMHTRRLQAAKKLPLWKRILFFVPIRVRALVRREHDWQRLFRHVKTKAILQSLGWPLKI